MKKLNAKEQQLRDLIGAFRSRVPPNTIVSSNDPSETKELAVLLGVINRLQEKSPGCYSNLISRHHPGTDTVYILILNYDSSNPRADHYWSAIIELAPLRRMPGGMELVTRFHNSFLDLYRNGRAAGDIWWPEFN